MENAPKTISADEQIRQYSIESAVRLPKGNIPIGDEITLLLDNASKIYQFIKFGTIDE